MAEIIFTRTNGEDVVISIDATVNESHVTAATVTEHPVEEGAAVSDHVRPENDRLSLSLFITNTPVRDRYRPIGQTEDTFKRISHTDGVGGDVIAADLLVARANRRKAGDPIVTNPGQPPKNLRDNTKAVRLVSALALGGAAGTAVGAGLTVAGSVHTPAVPAKIDPQPLLEGGSYSTQANVLQFAGEFDRVRAVYNELRWLVGAGVVCTVVTSLRRYENMVFESMTTPRDVANGNAITVQAELRQVRIVSSKGAIAKDPVQSRAKAKAVRGNKPPEVPSEPQKKSASAWYQLSH